MPVLAVLLAWDVTEDFGVNPVIDMTAFSVPELFKVILT